MKIIPSFFRSLVIVVLIGACNGSADTPINETNGTSTSTDQKRFILVSPEKSNLKFSNIVTESVSNNVRLYEYMYNGAGVAIGDINNDGLVDIYLSANQEPDRLFLNMGNLQFKDITATAGLMSNGWRTGVTMTDINGDGALDIYVSRAGYGKSDKELRDFVYLNNNDLTFTESGVELGLDISLHSTQACFFDLDNDNDLDLYILAHPGNFGQISIDEVNALAEKRVGSDHLFRNDNGHFIDITTEAGIKDHAFGLGVSASDLNNDGFCDLYVSNDYDAPDIYYMNNGNGKFSDKTNSAFAHVTNFGMGTDIADINHDGNLDLISVDMAFETHERSKMNMGSMSQETFLGRLEVGWQYQYMHNMVQLNHGNGHFSEIAQAIGLNKSDWSWAPLWCDLDNDGRTDLFITNGYRRDLKNNDANNKVKELAGSTINMEEYLGLFPVNKIENRAFKNHGDLKFQKISDEWGIDQAMHSNGAAYADLDNDGDLDFVINNLDEASVLYENTTDRIENGHWLTLDLKGLHGNTNGIGSKVQVRTKEHHQWKEQHLTRGYQSSVDPRLHFGLGSATIVDEIIVDWPNGQRSILMDLKVDSIITVHQNASTLKTPYAKTPIIGLFAEQPTKKGIDFVHRELPYDDFAHEILLPHKQSQHGPFTAIGDVNGDGNEDVFIGGAHNQKASLFLQLPDGGFKEKAIPVFEEDKTHEDLGSLFLDIDQDGDLDLYVCSGGVEFPLKSAGYQDRLYINDGNGNFSKSPNLPSMPSSTGTVQADDIDSDGDLDLVIGGRNVPGKYPFRPRSFVLRNDNGSFSDITDELAPDLKYAGMITSMHFSDMDGDNDNDLVVTGEWMPLTIYYNENGHLNKGAHPSLKDSDGWWYSAEVGDLDNDGDLDIVAGNLGMNNKFHPKLNHPLHLYCNDFDGSGSFDIVLAKYQGETCYPVRGRECSSQQMPFITDKFPTYQEYSVADLEGIYGKPALDSAMHLMANTLQSKVFWNEGNGAFKSTDFPLAAQFAPINGIVLTDVNDDNNLDIIAAGNMFGAEVETTRYDAGTGIVLINQGNELFEEMSVQQSGLFLNGDVKSLERIRLANGQQAIVVTNNNAAVQLVAIVRQGS